MVDGFVKWNDELPPTRFLNAGRGEFALLSLDHGTMDTTAAAAQIMRTSRPVAGVSGYGAGPFGLLIRADLVPGKITFIFPPFTTGALPSAVK